MRLEDLDVWKRAARLSAAICQDQDNAREYGFKDPVTRAGLSIARNIAEGTSGIPPGTGSSSSTAPRVAGADAPYPVLHRHGGRLHERQQGNEWVRETRELSALLYGLIKAFRQ